MDETRRLAAALSELTFDRLPEQVIRKAKLCLLDFLANVYGSLELEAVGRIVSGFRRSNMAGISTVLGCGFRTEPRDAAFLNGVTAEAVEAQDGLRFGGNHPGTAVIPAALAVAEELGSDGRQVLEAVVAGYEAANRIAAAVHPRHTLSGFLPTGTCGTFGAACAAAKLLGLDRTGMRDALGCAGYLAPLSMAEQLMGGFTVKVVQGGQAAACGISAAGLARAGITGAPHVLEGSALKGGFTLITTADNAALERITERLGEHHTILDVYLKPYTACRHTHGAAQAALALARDEQLRVQEVEAVEVFTYGIAALAVGKTVTKEDSFVSAQFSIPYVVACCLTDGEMGPRQLREDRLRDPSLLELCTRVAVRYDEELNRAYPERTSTRVEVRLASGKRLVRQVEIPKGDPRDPLSEEEVSAKVRRFAARRDRPNVEEAIRLARRFDELGDVREWTALV
ncbi:MAG: MmgE/PrpD family protein [bacterium]